VVYPIPAAAAAAAAVATAARIFGKEAWLYGGEFFHNSTHPNHHQ